MQRRTDLLTDLSRGVRVGEYRIDATSGIRLAGTDAWSITATTLRGGQSEGVDVVRIDNGRLAVEVLPTRGMGLRRGTCDGIELGWKSPVEFPVNPAFVELGARGGLGWLAGFNEFLCRCGLEFNGPPGLDVITNNLGHRVEAPLTLHGKIANIPAHAVSVEIDPADEGTLAITGVVDEAMLFGPNLRLRSTLSTQAGSNRLTIVDEVTNRGGVPAELQLLYHWNFGPPLLGAGASFVAPLRRVVPRDARAAETGERWNKYPAPIAGATEQVYFLEPRADAQGRSLALLRDPSGTRGASIAFRVDELPCLTLWVNAQAEADGYVTALEPGTSYPNFKAFERAEGRVVALAPGETRRFEVELAVHSTPHDVEATVAAIAAIAAAHPPAAIAPPLFGPE
ncbi:MAG: aldose 1-epimerase family protein [Planctomycetales bacterium]